MENTERTAREKILMILCGGTAVGLVPFVIVRFLHGDWQVAVLDIFLVLTFATLYFVVRHFHKTLLVSVVLAVFALFGNVVSSYLKGPSQIYWLYPTMIITFYILPARLAMALNSLAVLMIIPAYWGQIDSVTATSIVITFILTNLFAYVFSSQMKKQQDMLRQLSEKDSLTGVGNRRALLDELTQQKNGKDRNRRGTACVILMDLDHFKAINDEFGHLTGDDILKEFTALLKQITSQKARIFRYGGEEFVVVLECDVVEDCWQLAEKIRNMTELKKFVKDIHLTVSLGIAEIDGNEDLDSWLNRADKALYKAKNSGRNQTRLSPQTQASAIPASVSSSQQQSSTAVATGGNTVTSADDEMVLD